MIAVAVILGFAFGWLWAAFVLLPLLYGVPRSILWALRGLVTWYMPLSCIVGACLGAAVVFGARLLLFVFAPSYFGEGRLYDDILVNAATFTIACYLLASLTRRSRQSLRRDFVTYAGGYFTAKGQAHLQELIDLRLTKQDEHKQAA